MFQHPLIHSSEENAAGESENFAGIGDNPKAAHENHYNQSPTSFPLFFRAGETHTPTGDGAVIRTQDYPGICPSCLLRRSLFIAHQCYIHLSPNASSVPPTQTHLCHPPTPWQHVHGQCLP